MKKAARFLLMSLVFGLLLWAGILFLKKQQALVFKNKSEKNLAAQLLLLSDQSQNKFSLNNKVFSFEVVNSETSRVQGLSGRNEIGADGMLFVFSKPGYHGIWMKEMHFALDLIWFDRDGQVIDLHQDVLPPSNVENTFINTQTLSVYKPKQPAVMVLEVPAGFVSSQSVNLNSQIDLINSK